MTHLVEASALPANAHCHSVPLWQILDIFAVMRNFFWLFLYFCFLFFVVLGLCNFAAAYFVCVCLGHPFYLPRCSVRRPHENAGPAESTIDLIMYVHTYAYAYVCAYVCALLLGEKLTYLQLVAGI